MVTVSSPGFSFVRIIYTDHGEYECYSSSRPLGSRQLAWTMVLVSMINLVAFVWQAADAPIARVAFAPVAENPPGSVPHSAALAIRPRLAGATGN
jgi:hypothetical protein